MELFGICSALVTPFTVEGDLDLAGLTRNVRHQYESGIRNFCPLGGTGEPLALNSVEQRQVIDTVLAEVGGKARVIVGCLLPSQREIIDIARYAKKAGADAIMVIPPYFVNATPKHVRRHFEDVATADMPMVLFNGPTRAGLKLETEFVLELAEAIPSFVGIKDATGDLLAVSEIVRSAPARFAVLQGFDELLLPTLVVGGKGGIVSLTCLIPRMLVRLYQSFAAGDISCARALQFKILPLAKAIYSEPNPVPLKHAMNTVGLAGGTTRAPLYPISKDTVAALAQALLAAMAEENRL